MSEKMGDKGSDRLQLFLGIGLVLELAELLRTAFVQFRSMIIQCVYHYIIYVYARQSVSFFLYI